MKKGVGAVEWSPEMVSFAELCLERDMTFRETAKAMSDKFGIRVGRDSVRYHRRKGQLKDFVDRLNISKENEEYFEGEEIPLGKKDRNKSTNFAEDGNSATLEYKTTENPKSLKELLETCGVDTTKWEVDRYVVNKWEVAMRIDGKVVHRPLFQVKAWLIRIIPVKVEFPVVSPVRAVLPPQPPAMRGRKRSLRKALIIPDSQNGYRRDLNTGILDPFHDRKAWDICLQVAQQLKPDINVLLGDMLDLPDWTDKFLKSPEFYFTTQPAINELYWWIAQLRDTGAEIVYIEGNHEFRMTRAVMTNLISAYNVKPANAPEQTNASMTVPHLLGLSELGVDYRGSYPNGEYWINDNLRCSHGTLARTGNLDSVKAILRDARNSEIVGHIHRHEYAVKTVHPRKGAKSYVAYSAGTIARVDAGIVPAAKSKNDWQQAFGVVEFEEGNGMFNIIPHSINDGKVVFDGRLISHRKDIDKILNDAMGWTSKL